MKFLPSITHRNVVPNFHLWVNYPFKTNQKPLSNGCFGSGLEEYTSANANMARALLHFSKLVITTEQMLRHLIQIHKPVQFG